MLCFLLAVSTHRQSRTQTGTRRIARWVSLSGVFHEEEGTRRAVAQGRSLGRNGAEGSKPAEEEVGEV